MTTTAASTTTPSAADQTATARTPAGTPYADAARDHLWGHFTRQSVYEPTSLGGHDAQIPIIVRGEGHRIWDDRGREYIDGLAGLFTVQVGHGREELAQAAARQARELAFFPLWSYAHPRDRARRAAGGLRPRRPQPGLLHDRWR